VTTRRSALKTLTVLLLTACQSTLMRLRGFKVVHVATIDKVPPGGAYRTKLAGEEPIIVVNVNGEVRAFEAVCTHEGCPLGWNPTQHLIRCPCHGSAFDTRGEVVNGPAILPLKAYAAYVEDGLIAVAYLPNDTTTSASKSELRARSIRP